MRDPSFSQDSPMPADHEGAFDAQLSLPLPFVAAPQPFKSIVKRDGRHEDFDKKKIARAIFHAAQSVGAEDQDRADSLASAVALYLGKVLHDQSPTVDQVHDAVERVLVQMSDPKTALAYARYRDRRARIRRLRQGDLRVLLSELEEARHERESSGLTPPPLFIRTSAETVTSWDSTRIVEALVRETHLDRGLATVVALEVEQQIQQAEIRTLTTSLVRELVGAKLIEHGLEEYRDRHRRLGVPLYDVERILHGQTPETVTQPPEGTDRVLARAVKKEYALAQVYSPPVAEAHLKGALHLQDLGLVDRLHAATHPMETIIRHGIGLPGSRSFAEPPHYPETLLAQLVKATELFQGMFSGDVRWDAVNVYFAPFLQRLAERELQQFAQMLVYEFAFRALTHPEQARPVILELCWTVPAGMRQRDALGPSGIPTGRRYGDYQHTAQQLAWAIVDLYARGRGEGVPFPSPLPEIRIDTDFFRADGHEVWLGQVAKAAAAGAGVQVHFQREHGMAPADTQPWQAQAVSVHQVVLNLPRAAYQAGKEAGLLAHLDGLVELALTAHEEKRNFLEPLLDSGGMGPLAFLGVCREGSPYIELSRAQHLIAVDGLNECVQVLLNMEVHRSDEAAALGDRILAHLRGRIEERSAHRGLNARLSQNNDPAISNRFATLDLQDFPRTARTAVKPHPRTQALQYTPGARLNWAHDLVPAEGLRMEGRFHAHLAAGALASVPLPHAHTGPGTVADFVKKAYHHSTVKGLVFE